MTSIDIQGPVAQRIRHLTTNQGIPGSNPGRVVFFLTFFYSDNTHSALALMKKLNKQIFCFVIRGLKTTLDCVYI